MGGGAKGRERGAGPLHGAKPTSGEPSWPTAKVREDACRRAEEPPCGSDRVPPKGGWNRRLATSLNRGSLGRRRNILHGESPLKIILGESTEERGMPSKGPETEAKGVRHGPESHTSLGPGLKPGLHLA